MILIKWIIKMLTNFIDWLKGLLITFSDPVIINFEPMGDYAGAIIDIEGNNFGKKREDNIVIIGGTQARVIEATENKLKVISAFGTSSGKIEVKIGSKHTLSDHDFIIKDYPSTGSDEDGPPVLYAGQGFPTSGDVPSTGTLRILVCLVNPSDRVPADPTTSRTNVVNAWTNVSNYFNQVSYGSLTVQVDIFNNWRTLSGNFNDYINDTDADSDTSDAANDARNIKFPVLSRLMAESAAHAQGTGEGWNLNNYQLIACVINLDGTFIRAWGGSSTNNFRYDPMSINITTTNPINELWIQESADWGRYAHETAHNIVSKPSGITVNDDFAERTLGEDIYGSDLIDPSAASAEDFDLMGNHDSHPMLSAYHMEKTAWYNSSNIRELVWDRNALSQEFDIIAHGTAQDTVANRYHLIKIKVGDGLFYYVEVRQRPNPSEYLFDTDIPVPAGTNGGVVVTKVMTDVVNNNQQMRFISLLHNNSVLRLNETAIDPARTLQITVTNDNVASRPLVCRVRIAWAQNISDDPNGQFDLRLEPWDSNYQSPDIWVDRNPFGVFDQSNDSAGRPRGNGDKPRPRQINKFYSRIHNDGPLGTNNVKVSYYAINPPGVGDNGNWTPIKTETISSIGMNSFQDISTNWVPVLGQHTCLKVFVSQQAGEISGGNNFAQENVFDFEAPAASVPQAVYIPVALRNPMNKAVIMRISITGVKVGYIVQFPNEWVKLDALEERVLQLTVVPYLEYEDYKKLSAKYSQSRILDYASKIRVTGLIPRSYKEKIEKTILPGSKIERIGGIFTVVKPKKKVDIKISLDNKQSNKEKIVILGQINPSIANQNIIVDLMSPLFDTLSKTTTTNSSGHFTAIFELNKIFNFLKDQGKITDYNDMLKRLNSKCQAHVFNAPEVAEATSNIINIPVK